MERMDMHSRDEYLKVMRKSYIEARSRKEREKTYRGQVRAALARIWRIFDYPCGRRLNSERH